MYSHGNVAASHLIYLLADARINTQEEKLKNRPIWLRVRMPWIKNATPRDKEDKKHTHTQKAKNENESPTLLLRTTAGRLPPPPPLPIQASEINTLYAQPFANQSHC